MRIDCETHFLSPGYVAYVERRTSSPRWEVLGDEKRRLYYDASSPDLFVDHSAQLNRTLLDLGDERIATMDASGVDLALVSLSGPHVEQFEPDDSLEQACAANEALAEAVARYPDRLVGQVMVAPRKPEESAEEIERCVTKHGFRGVNVVSHVHDEAPYLDHRKYWPIFEAAARLGVPVNVHPTVPHATMIGPYLGYGWALPAPGLGFGHETALHAMRLIYSGLFDEYPNLKMTLGHFGESLTFWVYRMDFDFVKDWLDPAHRPKLERRPSEYLKENFWFNSSGNFLNSALLSCLMELGADRLTFASDYPWESMQHAASWFDAAPLGDADREKIEWRNAAELYGLPVEASAPVAP